MEYLIILGVIAGLTCLYFYLESHIFEFQSEDKAFRIKRINDELWCVYWGKWLFISNLKEADELINIAIKRRSEECIDLLMKGKGMTREEAQQVIDDIAKEAEDDKRSSTTEVSDCR